MKLGKIWKRIKCFLIVLSKYNRLKKTILKKTNYTLDIDDIFIELENLADTNPEIRDDFEANRDFIVDAIYTVFENRIPGLEVEDVKVIIDAIICTGIWRTLFGLEDKD